MDEEMGDIASLGRIEGFHEIGDRFLAFVDEKVRGFRMESGLTPRAILVHPDMKLGLEKVFNSTTAVVDDGIEKPVEADTNMFMFGFPVYASTDLDQEAVRII